VEWQGQQLSRSLHEAVMRVVVRGTEAVKTRAVRSIMSGGKTGRIYTRRGVVHQASAPGQSPASDTGRLVQSARTEYNNEEMSGKVIFSTAYAAALEFGTEKMEARPYLRPAFLGQLPTIKEDLANELRNALGRMG
jgi:HK97 gp10 family phage protein